MLLYTNFLVESISFDKKSNSTLLVNVAGNIARVNSVDFCIRKNFTQDSALYIYIYTCDTNIYIYFCYE